MAGSLPSCLCRAGCRRCGPLLSVPAAPLAPRGALVFTLVRKALGPHSGQAVVEPGSKSVSPEPREIEGGQGWGSAQEEKGGLD